MTSPVDRISGPRIGSTSGIMLNGKTDSFTPEYGGLIFQTLGGLLTRETSPKQLMGPVAIAQLSGEYAALGWIPLFSLMAMISLNLGILNLLPIPVLDGGHIFIMGIEAIARRALAAAVWGPARARVSGRGVLICLRFLRRLSRASGASPDSARCEDAHAPCRIHAQQADSGR